MKLFDLFDKFSLNQVLIPSKVVDNNDPKKLHRIKVTNPYYEGIPKDKLPWAVQLDSVFNSNTNNTKFYVPNIGDTVLVTFLNDIYHPVYVAGISSQPTTTHLQTYPDAYGFVDSSGNQFYIDRKTKKVKFTHSSGTSITILSDGKLTIYAKNDMLIKSDTKITMQAPDIELNP